MVETITPWAVMALAVTIGVPISFSLMAFVMAYVVVTPVPATFYVQSLVASVESFPLLAIPFFVVAGTLMARGGIADRIFHFADAFVGHLPGGLGQVNVWNSVVMGGMTGSNNADAAIDAKVLVPIMVREGYPLGFAAALSAASGIFAALIPPSITLIIYGMLAEVSIGRLFIAGIVPALFGAITMSLVVRSIAIRHDYGIRRERSLRFGHVVGVTRSAMWALMMPVLLLVGLRAGAFTPTELGALATIYALVVGVAIHRDMSFGEIVPAFREAAVNVGSIMLLIAAGTAFGRVLIMERVPQQVAETIQELTQNPLAFLLIINVVLLAMGALMDGSVTLIILTPMLAPLAGAFEIDPIQFGIVMALNVSIATISPPVGSAMFTVCAITGCSVREYFRGVLPLLACFVVTLAVISLVPGLSTWLPDLILGMGG